MRRSVPCEEKYIWIVVRFIFYYMQCATMAICSGAEPSPLDKAASHQRRPLRNTGYWGWMVISSAFSSTAYDM